MSDSIDNKEDIWTSGWRMFSTPDAEIRQMLVGHGTVSFNPDLLTVENYPFQPSVAYKQASFAASDIDNIQLTSAPPTVKISGELIFIPATQRDELQLFAYANQIPIVERADVWSWILEPFLDTEYTEWMNKKVNSLLSQSGLSEELVYSIRQEVKTQMLKYNFDTMLWEWVHLGAYDVLCAMRTKYDKAQFRTFYQRVMEIALLPDK